MKIWIAFIVLALVDSGAALLISKGMKRMGKISTRQPQKLLRIARRAVKNMPLLLGFLFEFCNFFFFLALLSWTDLSMIIPVMGSASYLISIVGAKFFLKEDVTRERWLGTLFIGAGVALISLQ